MLKLTKRPKPQLPDTGKFDGDLKLCRSWATGIRTKLRIDGAAIGDSQAQIAFFIPD